MTWAPMKAGADAQGKAIDLISVFEGVGAHAAGTIDDARLEELEAGGCPTCGSCSGMFTANSMNCLTEALGLNAVNPAPTTPGTTGGPAPGHGHGNGSGDGDGNGG